MLKRKQMIVAAATLAAAPLATKAATIVFSYDPTVIYGTVSGVGGGGNVTGTTGTATIVNNKVTIPAGDFFQFNVNVLVTNNANTASGGAYDSANGKTQPANLGLTGFGYVVTDSVPAAVLPVNQSGNEYITAFGPNGATSPAYASQATGADNQTTGQVGSNAAPLSGGLSPGSVNAAKSSTYYNLTLGAGTAQDIFAGMEYHALTSATSVLTFGSTSGSLAYASLASAGGASTKPTYTVTVASTNDSITNLPALTINPTVTSGTSNNIISLTSTAPNSNVAPSAYGTTSLGTVTANGSGTKFTAGTLALSPVKATGFVNGVLNSSPTAGSPEVYALDIESSGGGTTAPGDLATIAAAMQTALNTQLGAGSATVSTSWTGTAPFNGVNPFPGGPAGTPGYDVFIAITANNPNLANNFLGFDLTEGGSFSTDTVAAVALVPEPASAAFILVGASSLLLGRRKRSTSQVA